MSQSSTSNMQAPNPMKQKVIAAVIAVLVGHMGALWALSHLKTPELKPIEKKPIQVKFVKIKEEQVIPPPPPPPPPVKPKVEPKPVVEKKAPPPPIEKPKLITQKKPVVEKKAIQQEEPKIDHEKIKREQEQRQLEQQRLEQQRQEQQRLEQQRQEQQRLEQQRQEQQRQEQLRQQQEQQRRQQEAQQPRKLSAGEISWKKAPSFEFDDELLKNQDRSLLVRIEINPAGKITNVTVLKSSGLPILDREVRSAVRFARMNPSNDGRAMVADLPVSLKTSGQ